MPRLIHASFALAALAGLLLTGCTSSLVAVSPGSDHVVVRDAAAVASCQSKGGIDVTVMDHVWFYHRDKDTIATNLNQLARNGAVESGADTIVPGDYINAGTRHFQIYKCAM